MTEFIEKSVDFSVCCSECRGEWGCTLCMFRIHCDESNEGLLAPLGAPIMKLTEIKQKEEETQTTTTTTTTTTSVETTNLDPVVTPAPARAPLSCITNTMNSPNINRNVVKEEKKSIRPIVLKSEDSVIDEISLL